MQTLDIECPSCAEMLELDAGFAGGVCRCSNCGTLMTVPSDAGKAESLSRPGSSASVGAGGLSSMGVPDPGPSRRSSAKRSTKSKKSKSNKSKANKRPAPIVPGEYRTASGKVVKLDETTRVPMAESKKKQIRVATTVVFFAVILAVVVAAGVGIIAMMGGPGAVGIGGNDGPVAYDPATNPYDMTAANVAGLPLPEGQTTVVIEASEYSADWIAQAKDLIVNGLTKEAGGAEVALIAAADKPINLAGGAPRKLPLKAGELNAWFDDLPDTGEADLTAALRTATGGVLQTLILVIGYADTADIEAWDAVVADQDGLTVHTVLIGNDSAEVRGWMASRDGSITVVLLPSEIEALKEMAGQTESN